MDLTEYINNQELYIDSITWHNLKKEYPKDIIVSAICDAIVDHNLPMPLVSISEESASKDFHKLLTEDIEGLLTAGNMYSRYAYNDISVNNSNDLYYFSNISKAGLLASNYFHQEARYMCGSVNAPSPYRTWTNKKFLAGAVSALFTLKCSEVSNNTLRNCIALRKYIASQFRPKIAKEIYTMFHSKRVLDFSAGWGDRLCGFCASDAEYYVGIDPNKKVYDNYQNQVDFYTNISGRIKNTVFINKPFEEVDITEKFDTVFTSPPYFNIERYTEENNQSFKRYKKFDDWVSQFLCTALAKAFDALVPNGYLIINISDVYSGHKVNPICTTMCKFMEKYYNVHPYYVGMQMAKRPQSKAINVGVFVEPIWIWQKK